MGEFKWHKYSRNRLDPYVNLALGVQLRRYKILDNAVALPAKPEFKKTSLHLAGEFSVGTRYFFANNLAVFGEAGFGVFYLKVGLTAILRP